MSKNNNASKCEICFGEFTGKSYLCDLCKHENPSNCEKHDAPVCKSCMETLIKNGKPCPYCRADCMNKTKPANSKQKTANSKQKTANLISIEKSVRSGKNKLKNKTNLERKKAALFNFKAVKPTINRNVVFKQELLKSASDEKTRETAKKNLNSATKLKREVNDLISETTPDQPYKLYRVLNKFLNPIIYLRWKSIIFFIVSFSILIASFILIFKSKTNSGVYIVVCVYIILYLFFMHTMNIKMSCGKNTSLLELLNPKKSFGQSFTIFWSAIRGEYDEDYIELIKEYECFKYGDEAFSFKNVNKINNLNTNFNKNLEGYFNKTNNNNKKYPDRLPSKKYIFLTIYLLSVIFLFAKSVMDEFTVSKDSGKEDDEGKTEQIINSIIVCLIFFIWTCVLDLPMWILIVLIVVLILIYLLIGAADLYNSLGTGKVDNKMLCKPHIIPFVNTSWAGVSFQDNLTNCMNDKSNGMFLTMMKPYLETINGLEKQLDDQNSKLNNLGNVVDMFKDKVQKMIEPIYSKIKGIIDKIIKIKNKIYDIMKNIILMFKSMIWTMVNLIYSIESIHNIICDLPLVDCCFDEKTVIKTIGKTNMTKDKLIKDIEVGDVLIDDSIVLGVIKSKYTNQDIYSYKNICATGDHFVYDNGEHKNN